MKAGQSGRCSDREFAFVLDVFLVLKVAGPTGGQIRWPHLRSDWRPR